MTTEIEQVVVLLFESVDDLFVLFCDLLDAFNTQVLNALRLVDEFYQFDDLLQPFRESVELAKYVVLATTSRIFNVKATDK